MSRFLRIVTANVRGYPAMSPQDVWDDLAAIRDRLEPDLLATQEMWWPRYRRALRRIFRLSQYGHATPRSVAGTCVSWYRNLGDVVETGSTLLHGAVPGVCAWRRITYTVLQLQPGPRVAFASTHPTPSAFSHRFSGNRKARVESAWHHGMDRLHDWIDEQLTSGCTHVAIGLDANASQARLRAALGEHINGTPITYRSNGIDHIVLVGRWDVDHHGTPLEHPHSDHKPLMVIAKPMAPTT